MNTLQKDSQPIPAAGRERVVRVFVSSTFRDMVEDRNEPMARTWPALRRRCRERAYEPSRKSRVTRRMAVCITIFLFLLSSMAGVEAAVTTSRPVQVVIIDKVDESGAGKQQAKSEHGEIIAEIIRQECPKCLIEILLTSDGFEYYQALAKVLEMMERDQPERSKSIIVNISLGHAGSSGLEAMVVRLLTEAGAIIVAAVGNEGTDKALFPAAYPGVIAVAGIEYRWRWNWPPLVPQKASYSNFGPHVSLAAKAGYVSTAITSKDGGSIIQTLSEGSSFAAPRVVGLLGRMLTADDHLTPAKALEIVLKTARPLPEDPAFSNGNLGAGVIDGKAAMAIVNPGVDASGLRAFVERAADFLKESGGYLIVIIPAAAVLIFFFRITRSRSPVSPSVKENVDTVDLLVELNESLGIDPDPELVAQKMRAALPELEYHARDSKILLELDHIIHFLARHNEGGRFNHLLERLRELERY